MGAWEHGGTERRRIWGRYRRVQESTGRHGKRRYCSASPENPARSRFFPPPMQAAVSAAALRACRLCGGNRRGRGNRWDRRDRRDREIDAPRAREGTEGKERTERTEETEGRTFPHRAARNVAFPGGTSFLRGRVCAVPPAAGTPRAAYTCLSGTARHRPKGLGKGGRRRRYRGGEGGRRRGKGSRRGEEEWRGMERGGKRQEGAGGSRRDTGGNRREPKRGEKKEKSAGSLSISRGKGELWKFQQIFSKKLV